MCPLLGNLLSVTFDPETADKTFNGHYVATIKVATSLFIIIMIIIVINNNTLVFSLQ